MKKNAVQKSWVLKALVWSAIVVLVTIVFVLTITAAADYLNSDKVRNAAPNVRHGWFMDVRNPDFFHGSVGWTKFRSSDSFSAVNPEEVEAYYDTDESPVNCCRVGNVLVGKLTLDYWTGTSDEQARSYAKLFCAKRNCNVIVGTDNSCEVNKDAAVPEHSSITFYLIRK